MESEKLKAERQKAWGGGGWRVEGFGCEPLGRRVKRKRQVRCLEEEKTRQKWENNVSMKVLWKCVLYV